jgi:hypothetical protein
MYDDVMLSRRNIRVWPLTMAAGAFAVVCAVACTETEPAATTSSSGAGGTSAQGGSAQGGSAQGGSAQGGSGQGGSDCSGPCSTHDLQASFGNATSSLSRAVYGLTSPANASSGKWEIYLEAHEGGDAGCPMMSSATPKHTLVVTGLPAPLPAEPRSEADAVSASLLDFDGALLGATPVAKATAVSITPTASSVCTACVGQGPDASGYVALDIVAKFDGGDVTGHIYATHCESLDAP